MGGGCLQIIRTQTDNMAVWLHWIGIIMKCERRLRSEMLDNEGGDGYHRLTNVDKSVEGMFFCLICHRLCRHDVNLHRSTSSPYVIPGRFECVAMNLRSDTTTIFQSRIFQSAPSSSLSLYKSLMHQRSVASSATAKNYNFSLPHSSHQPVSIKDDV